jgi:TonB family protein
MLVDSILFPIVVDPTGSFSSSISGGVGSNSSSSNGGGGSTKKGEGGGSVLDLLGSSSGSGDLDSLLSGAGGITTGEGGGLGGGGGGLGLGLGGEGGGLGDLSIDSLVEGSMEGGSTELKKSGSVSISTPSSISGEGASSSGRTSSAIYSIVKAHSGGIQHAYELQLKSNPGLGGKIVVQFTISASGSVSSVSIVSSTVNNSALESAVVNRIYNWRFPPVDEGSVTVVYPFVFVSTG